MSTGLLTTCILWLCLGVSDSVVNKFTLMSRLRTLIFRARMMIMKMIRIIVRTVWRPVTVGGRSKNVMMK